MKDSLIKKLNKFTSLYDLQSAFPTEKSCIKFLELIRWNNKIISPFDESSKVYKCKNNRYYCKNTNRYFNVKTKTLFESSNIKLQKWFMAVYIITSHKKGISNQRVIDIIKTKEILKTVKKSANIYTDEWLGYNEVKTRYKELICASEKRGKKKS